MSQTNLRDGAQQAPSVATPGREDHGFPLPTVPPQST